MLWTALPKGSGGQALFFAAPWSGLSRAALVCRSCFFWGRSMTTAIDCKPAVMPTDESTDTRRLWVYKCNPKGHERQSAIGDWDQFFDNPTDDHGRWGGTWGIKSPASRKIMLELIKAGDLILAYRSGAGEAVGLCRFMRLDETKRGQEMVLEPVLRLDAPIRLLDLKKVDAGLLTVRFLESGQGTLYPVSPEELAIVLPHLPDDCRGVLDTAGIRFPAHHVQEGRIQ